MSIDANTVVNLIFMIWIANLFYTGTKFYRCAAWLTLWVVLTPERHVLDSTFMMLSGWFLLEWFYTSLSRIGTKTTNEA